MASENFGFDASFHEAIADAEKQLSVRGQRECAYQII